MAEDTSGWTLVTGASDGIGKELARIAARNGRKVILTARSEGKLKALADDLASAHGTETEIILSDLSDPSAAEKLWADATKNSRQIDFLINNAGLGKHGNFGDDDAARETASIQVNLIALTDLMREAVRHMKARGEGRILNVASIAAYTPGPNMAVYHATKAYVLSLSQAVNAELSEPNISVTALCPGATQSNFFNEADMHGVKLVKSGNLPTAASVAETGYSAAIGRNPVAIHGFMNKMTVLLTRVIPGSLSALITKKVMSKG